MHQDPRAPCGSDQHVISIVAITPGRDEEPELKFQFEIVDVPTIMLIRNHKYYTFDRDATLKNLTRFSKREYKTVPANDLLPPKNRWDKLWFVFIVHFISFRSTVDNLGFGFLPTFMKDLIILLFLCSPVIAVLMCVKMTQEPDAKGRRQGEETRAENLIWKRKTE